MTFHDLVSVIIPCYNPGEYLKAAIDSALTQDYPHVEVIVINDGSTDGSLEVAREYGSSIQLIDQPNRGRSVARNVGLDRAKGEFIKLLDADDRLAGDCLSYQVHAMGKESVWNEATTFVCEDGKSPSIAANVCLPDVDLWQRLLGCGLPVCAPLVRASVLKGIRFPEGMECGEDTIFQSMIWRRIGRPARIPFVEEAKCFVYVSASWYKKYPPMSGVCGTIALLDSWDDDTIRAFGVRHVAIETLTQELRGPMRRGYRNKECLRRARDVVRRLCEVDGVDSREALSNLRSTARSALRHSRIRRVRSWIKASLVRVGGRGLAHALLRK